MKKYMGFGLGYFSLFGLFPMGVSLYVNFTNVVSIHRPSPDFVYQSCRKERDMPQQLFGDTVRCNTTSLRCPIVIFFLGPFLWLSFFDILLLHMCIVSVKNCRSCDQASSLYPGLSFVYILDMKMCCFLYGRNLYKNSLWCLSV
jgi:hypothetical protein